VLLAAGVFVFLRSCSGRLRPDVRATLDNTVLMGWWVCAQGVLGMLVVQLGPRLAALT